MTILGGRTEEYRVVADPARLAAAGVTLEELVQAVSAANVVEAVGRLEENEKLYLLLSDTRFLALADLEAVIVRRGPTGTVHVADLATVEATNAPEWTRVTADGKDAVLVNVYQQPGGNTTRISRDIRARLAELQGQLGNDVRLQTWYDQSTLISAAASSVRDAILIGIGLAIVVLLGFLRSWKVTLVVALAVPVVLAATALVLKALGMGLNIMTLGGMAAAVGLIVDDGIVMVEHVIRRLREEPDNVHHAVPIAAREMLGPLAASSAATVIIFVPLAFLTGVTGAFFKALSLTMAAALAISFLFAASAVPALADHLLGAREAHADDVGRWLGRVLDGYERLLRRLLARPILVALVVAPLIGLGWLGLRQVGSGFMPSMDEGGFILDYVAPAGTLADRDRPAPAPAGGAAEGHPRRRDLVASHRPRPRWRDHRGQRGRLLHPSGGRTAAPDRRRHRRRQVAHPGPGSRARGRVRAAHGGPDRRPHGGTTADRGQAVRTVAGGAQSPGGSSPHRRSPACPGWSMSRTAWCSRATLWTSASTGPRPRSSASTPIG